MPLLPDLSVLFNRGEDQQATRLMSQSTEYPHQAIAIALLVRVNAFYTSLSLGFYDFACAVHEVTLITLIFFLVLPQR